jgi:hypothetical protein
MVADFVNAAAAADLGNVAPLAHRLRSVSCAHLCDELMIAT